MDDLSDILRSVREDDFVEYFVFPQMESNDEKEQENVLNAVLGKANKVVEKYTKDYLWHKDEFKLVSRTNINNFFTHIERKEENLPPHLYGISHYGDNIEDEWFMVFILQEISKEISGTIIKVFDSDGEFLLIESADFLPSWAIPDTCENRVYIYEGNIHLLPPKDTDHPEILVQDALYEIWSHPKTTIANSDIQNSIQNKLKVYPECIKETFHHAVVYVPTGVAVILKEKQNLISAAVQAFCNRDPADMKACKAMKYFPPEQRVKARVKFTRCLYAMLSHSKYVPDKKIGWNLPPITNQDYKQYILGVKLACGFEILTAQAKPSQNIEGDHAWAQYCKCLKEKGYFKGLLEGSKEYNNLLNKAKEFYSEHRNSMHYNPVIGQEILMILRSKEVNFEELQKEGQDLPSDDSDSWLDISPEELDKMLQEKYGQKKIFRVNESTDAGSFTEKVTTFLNDVSDINGVEFPLKNGEGSSPVRPPRGKKVNKKGVSFSPDVPIREKNPENQNKVTFDPNSFASAIQNILNFVIPEDNSWDLDSDSDMGEYEHDDFVKDEDMINTDQNSKKNKMESYMEQMDRELSATTIGQSFEKKNDSASFEDVESFQPVDIDVNALKNILESYRSQLGEAGPSSSLLGPMGMHLEPKM